MDSRSLLQYRMKQTLIIIFKIYVAAYSIKVKNIKKLKPTQKNVATSPAILDSFINEANKND